MYANLLKQLREKSDKENNSRKGIVSKPGQTSDSMEYLQSMFEKLYRAKSEVKAIIPEPQEREVTKIKKPPVSVEVMPETPKKNESSLFPDISGFEGSDTLGGSSSGDILKDFEGFREKPYWDTNAYRVGYGSDTITKPDGSVVKVTKNSTVSKEDAERDLARRKVEFETKAKRSVGKSSWETLPPDAKKALVSLTYNYGSLPKSVVQPIRHGNIHDIADAVEKLKHHNGGINERRRKIEAEIIRNSG